MTEQQWGLMRLRKTRRNAMTEKEALLTAIENVEAAMSALDFPENSYAADEAFDLLDGALAVLNAGLGSCNDPESRSGAKNDVLEVLEQPTDPPGGGWGVA